MALAPKPIAVTQRAAVSGEPAPEPLVIVGAVPATALPAATTSTAGVVKKAASQATFAGADITALKVELNAWYAKLQTAGLVT